MPKSENVKTAVLKKISAGDVETKIYYMILGACVHQGVALVRDDLAQLVQDVIDERQTMFPDVPLLIMARVERRSAAN